MIFAKFALALFLGIALLPSVLALGSLPGLGWSEFEADRDVLLGSMQDGLQNDMVEFELGRIEYFNGVIEGADYDFLLISDEKTEFTGQDLAEIFADNAQTAEALSKLNDALDAVSISAGAGGEGYDRALDNLKAARSSVEGQLISASNIGPDYRQGIYSGLGQRANAAEEGLAAAGDALVTVSGGNVLASQFSKKWVSAGLAESAELKGRLEFAAAAERLEAQQIELGIKVDTAVAQGKSISNALNKLLNTPSDADGKTGLVDLPTSPNSGAGPPAIGSGAPAVAADAIAGAAAVVNVYSAEASESAGKAKKGIVDKLARAKIVKMQKSIKNLNDKVSKLKTRITSVSKRVTAINGKLNEARKSITANTEQISALEARAAALEAENVLLNQKYTTAQQALAKAQTDIEGLKTLTAEHAKKIEAAERMAIEANTKAQTANDAAARASQDAAGAKTEAGAANKRAGEAWDRANEANGKATDAQKRIGELEVEHTRVVDDFEARLGVSEAKATALEEQVQGLSRKVDDLTAKVAESEGTTVTTRETMSDGTVRETTVKAGKGGIVNVGRQQNVGADNTIGQGTGAKPRGAVTPEPVIPEPVTPNPVIDPNVPKPGDQDLSGPVKPTPPKSVEPEPVSVPPTPTQQNWKAFVKPAIRGALIIYGINLVTDYIGHLIVTSDYPNDNSYLPPNQIWGGEGQPQLTSSYVQSIGDDPGYKEVVAFKQNDMIKTISSEKNYMLVLTNAGKNIFAVRDKLRAELVKKSYLRIKTDQVLLLAAPRTLSEEYSMASFGSTNENDDTKLVKSIYLVVFPVNNGVISGTPTKIPGKSEFSQNEYYFSDLIPCSKTRVTTWSCDFSRINGLPKGKYAAVLFTKLDEGTLSANPTLMPKMKQLMQKKKCNFTMDDKSTKDYCQFIESLVPQNDIHMALEESKKVILDEKTIKKAFIDPIKAIGSGYSGAFEGVTWNPLTWGYAPARVALATMALPFVPLESAITNQVIYAKARRDIEAQYTYLESPANKLPTTAMFLGLPAIEEFEVGDAAIAPIVPATVAPAPVATLFCPSLAECLACVDKKLVHEVFGNVRGESYTCTFAPSSPAPAAAAPKPALTGYAKITAIKVNGEDKTKDVPITFRETDELDVEYESVWAWDKGKREISVWGEEPQGRPCDYYTTGIDGCVFLEGVAVAGAKAFSFDSSVLADAGAETSQPMWVQVELCESDDYTQCDNTQGAWKVSQAYKLAMSQVQAATPGTSTPAPATPSTTTPAPAASTATPTIGTTPTAQPPPAGTSTAPPQLAISTNSPLAGLIPADGTNAAPIPVTGTNIQQSTAAGPPNLTATSNGVLREIAKFRAANGLGPMKLNAKLQKWAQVVADNDNAIKAVYSKWTQWDTVIPGKTNGKTLYTAFSDDFSFLMLPTIDGFGMSQIFISGDDRTSAQVINIFSEELKKPNLNLYNLIAQKKYDLVGQGVSYDPATKRVYIAVMVAED